LIFKRKIEAKLKNNSCGGLLIIISGPSGVGKDTVIKEMLSLDSNLKLSVSATTRTPRPGEENGKSYLFLSKDEFSKMLNNGEFLEYTSYCGNFYGTPVRRVDDLLADGNDVILKIEVEGAFIVRKKRSRSVAVFINPPSLEVLAGRIRDRGFDDEPGIKKRLSRAEIEMKQSCKYDFVCVNSDAKECAFQITEFIKDYKARK
jgi:guanylate kinase